MRNKFFTRGSIVATAALTSAALILAPLSAQAATAAHKPSGIWKAFPTTSVTVGKTLNLITIKPASKTVVSDGEGGYSYKTYRVVVAPKGKKATYSQTLAAYRALYIWDVFSYGPYLPTSAHPAKFVRYGAVVSAAQLKSGTKHAATASITSLNRESDAYNKAFNSEYGKVLAGAVANAADDIVSWTIDQENLTGSVPADFSGFTGKLNFTLNGVKVSTTGTPSNYTNVFTSDHGQVLYLNVAWSGDRPHSTYWVSSNSVLGNTEYVWISKYLY